MRILISSLLLLTRLCAAQPVESFIRKPENFKGFFRPGQVKNYAQVPHSSEFDIQNNFTIEIMVRFENPLSTENGVIFCNSVGPNSQDDWGFGFISTLDHRFGFHVCNTSPAQIMANQTDTVSTCKWYHLAGVKQGQSIRFYLDGVLKATNVFPGPIRTSAGPALFGYHRPPYTHWHNGNMDEFRLWNFAKTAEQIRNQMNDTLLGNESGLRVYYKFNETGDGGGVPFKNSAAATGSALNGYTVSQSTGFPKLTSIDALAYPPPPLVPNQPAFCAPGGIFNLSVLPPNGLNINRFNWYQSDHPDSSRIPDATGKSYVTPFLGRTDTFFVSAVTNQSCEGRKVAVVASVLPGVGPINLVASVDTFCGKADVVLTADSISYPPVIYEWSRGFSGLEAFEPQTSGRVLKISNLSHSDTIWVTCTTMAGGCASNKPKAILTRLKNSPPPEVSLSDTLICSGKSTYLFVNGSPTEKVKLYSDSLMIHIDTTFNMGQPFKTPDLYHDKTYWISHSPDAKECIPVPVKISIKIKTLPELALPNLVTIDGDGKNDFFEVKELPDCYPTELRIFNRWGKEVYYASSYKNNWQGKAGTYFYLLRVGGKQYKGWLDVVK